MLMDEAERVRQRGNALYKAKKLTEALPLYRRAAKLAPENAAPQANLSATYFELGEYDKAVSHCDLGLALATDEAAKQKLSLRKAKCHLFRKEFDSAETALEAIQPSSEVAELATCVRFLEAKQIGRNDRSSPASRTHTAANQICNVGQCQSCEMQTLTQLSRNIPEYYTVAHDAPESLYIPDLLKSGRDKISLLFGGIGDARNLFQTLIAIGNDTRTGKLSKEVSFHMTFVDIKPAVIARDLLFFLMVERLTLEADFKSMYASGELQPLYYTFISPIMPRSTYELLQEHIRVILDVLEHRQKLPCLVEDPELYRPEIIRVLRQWQQKVPEEYPTQRLRDQAIKGCRRDAVQRMSWGIPEAVAKGCERQDALYRKTGILMLATSHDALMTEDQPELLKAFLRFKKGAIVDRQVLAAVDASWGPNVTMVDLDWQQNREDDYIDVDVANNPFDWALHLEEAGMCKPPKKGQEGGLFESVGYWLIHIVFCMKDIKPRVKIEACIGDISSVLEQIRYGIVGHRSVPTAVQERTDDASGLGHSTQPADDTFAQTLAALYEYPQAYDRIHLSNIPDYIGGTLVTYLDALPVLHAGDESFVTSTCLRNPPRWKTVAEFDNEYVALSSPTDLEKVFDIRMAPQHNNLFTMYPLAEYHKWHQCYRSKTLSDRLSRVDLETWLYRLFLKISIPKERTVRDDTLRYVPTNLTVFMRLCCHLHGIGYPAHWISGVLSSLLSGRVTTKARPPRSDPLEIREVNTRMPPLTQSIKPFVAELSSLVGIWQSILPFGMPVVNFPAPDAVRKYSFTLEKIPDEPVSDPPVFVLVFMDRTLLPRRPPNLRPYLLDDELGDKSSAAKSVREKGLHVLTTWTWDRRDRSAKFWLREDVMETMRRGDWAFAIWRSDNWTSQTKLLSLDIIHDAGSFRDLEDQSLA